MPSRSELERITTAWISLWCAPVDWPLFDRLHAEGFEDCSAAGRATSKEGFASGLKELMLAFPDLATKVEHLVVDIEKSEVAVRWSAAGTNRAKFLGIGPTGRLTTMTGIEIIEIRNSQIVRRWGEWDISAHMHQV